MIESIVTIGFLGAMMWGMMRFMLRDIHSDLAGIKKEISEMKVDMREGRIRADNLYQQVAEQGVRIDHLYHICIDLLKDRK